MYTKIKPQKIEYYFAMPNKFTFDIPIVEKIIKGYCENHKNPKLILNAFKGKSDNKEWISIDTNPEMRPTIIASAEYLPFREDIFEVILSDPPYSFHQSIVSYEGFGKHIKIMKVYQEFIRVSKNNTKLLNFGWNIPSLKGFFFEKLIILNHGGNHNATLITILKRFKLEIKKDVTKW